MTPRPKFFCENCGTEVRQRDKVCGHCGKFFASVKCPSCGFSGDAAVFRDGCPACGYAVYRGKTGSYGQGLGPGFGPGLTGGYGRGRSFEGYPPAKKKGRDTDPLPWWIYLASVLFLACLVALILVRR